MVVLGVHASLWTPEWSPEAAAWIIPAAAKSGIGVVEVNPFDFETDGAIDASAELFRSFGVKPVCSVGLPPEMGAPTRADLASGFLETAIGRAARLGATLLTGVPYTTLGYRSGKPPTQQEYDEIVALIKPAARRAADHGITIGLEVCNRYETHLLNTGAQGAALQEMIGEPNVTVHLDTYHMNIEEKSFSEGFKSVAGRCGYAHLSESHRGRPGTGTIDWDDVFAGLAAIDFDGIATLESFVNVPETFKPALAVWRDVAPNADYVLEGIPVLREAAARHGITLGGG
jgi:D-psicose/D-tagatose/L-ribulose 3-epimerase